MKLLVMGSILVLGLFSSLVSYAAPPKAFIKSGAIVVPNEKRTYYLQTNQYTEVTYNNAALETGTKVSLEFAYAAETVDANGRVQSLKWSRPTTTSMTEVSPGVYHKQIVHVRQGLGDTWRSEGMNFFFHVNATGQPEVLDRCSTSPSSVFSIRFPYVSALTWEQTPGEVPTLKVVGVDCINLK
jgi:hypothetical protein